LCRIEGTSSTTYHIKKTYKNEKIITMIPKQLKQMIHINKLKKISKDTKQTFSETGISTNSLNESFLSSILLT